MEIFEIVTILFKWQSYFLLFSSILHRYLQCLSYSLKNAFCESTMSVYLNTTKANIFQFRVYFVFCIFELHLQKRHFQVKFRFSSFGVISKERNSVICLNINIPKQCSSKHVRFVINRIKNWWLTEIGRFLSSSLKTLHLIEFSFIFLLTLVNIKIQRKSKKMASSHSGNWLKPFQFRFLFCCIFASELFPDTSSWRKKK